MVECATVLYTKVGIVIISYIGIKNSKFMM